MRDTSSATGKTVRKYLRVKTCCVDNDCRSRADTKAYEFDVPMHALPLAVLYAHTQHGACVLDVKVDGQWPFEFAGALK
jgi:hypothetical protein